MKRVTCSDGSTWPRPSLESDEVYGIGHRLTYLPQEYLTREDLLEAASIISAYGYLLVDATDKKVRMVRRDARAALREEADT